MYYIMHLDRTTGITTYLDGYFRSQDEALSKLNQIVSEYDKYPNVFSDYKIFVVQEIFVHDSDNTASSKLMESK